ncbi:undecaprenyl-diphospho-oligosaccharide flippase [Citrifermentans bemidjiense Bem]|uniref:Undecaprenyl-diphospho-oligosaccharide flippase n=1 Tax=Citrifermentans bemidjiense (strain ATCC BAA-1014 / DSM 16622 / JCM 12645 / Bem) TaxID=404380 RepID=B5E8P5_CITBB|nr:O-antigen translocase [Citrifermentans bemidjiense]ACH38630.1 undecaprenyl-diphospho-oligosaccharide flippase [Citrifermentans bemidjiense Bem]
MAAETGTTAEKRGSIGHILKASAVMGSSAVVQIATGILKNKVVALLLGPSGVGAFALLQSVQATASTVAGLGLNSSGVRQISDAEAKGGEGGVALCYLVLRRLAMAAAIIGALLMLLLRTPISKLAGYGGPSGATTIAILGIGVWATTVSGAQTALLNGLRRIGDLARVNGMGAIIGMLVTLAALWLLKESGIVVAVVGSSLATLLVSWFLSRKIELPNRAVRREEFLAHSEKLLRLGVVFMGSAVLTVGCQFVVRAILARKLGIEATGQFHAAWNISMLYVSFALNAMGTDFYPRLTAVADDHAQSRRMVNEQGEVAILLTAPVILGMLTFAPFVVAALYSSAFGATSEILRWQVLGDLFKIVAWPMGFVMLAQGSCRAFLVAELFWNGLYLALVAAGIPYFGVSATGISFFISYLLLCLLNGFFAYRLIKFVPSRANVANISVLFLLALLVTFLVKDGSSAGYLAGTLITTGVGASSLLRITRSLGRNPFSRK